MRVKVRFFGPLKDIAGKAESEVEVGAGADTAALLALLVRTHPRLDELADDFKVAVNREIARSPRPLKDGDEVALLPPVSGGAPAKRKNARKAARGARGAVRRARRGATKKPPVGVRVQRGDFSIDSLVDSVCRPEAGAVVLFLGTVKSPHEGREVVGIEHEAYDEMAEASLREIADEARAKHSALAVEVVHRKGRMRVGENIVGIAASAVRRQDAFDAARYVIEELKRRTPLWKKEFAEEGSWWVGRE